MKFVYVIIIMLSFQLSYSLEVKQSNKEIKFRVRGHYKLIYSNDWSILDSNLYLNNSSSIFGNKIPLKKIKYYEEIVGDHLITGLILGTVTPVLMYGLADSRLLSGQLQVVLTSCIVFGGVGGLIGYYLDDWEKFDMEEYVSRDKISFDVNPYYNSVHQLDIYGVSLTVNF